MGTQLIAKVVAFDEKEGFQLQNMEGFVWPVHRKDKGRIGLGDVVCIQLQRDVYPWNGDVSVFNEHDKAQYKLIRVSKGGNAAFQG